MFHPTIPSRRVWRPLGRPGRRRATDDPTLPPPAPFAVRATAAACRAALKALESAGAVRDADRGLHEIANALHPRLDVTVTTRTNRSPATCDAPNCAGHRVRA